MRCVRRKDALPGTHVPCLEVAHLHLHRPKRLCGLPHRGVRLQTLLQHPHGVLLLPEIDQAHALVEEGRGGGDPRRRLAEVLECLVRRKRRR